MKTGPWLHGRLLSGSLLFGHSLSNLAFSALRRTLPPESSAFHSQRRCEWQQKCNTVTCRKRYTVKMFFVNYMYIYKRSSRCSTVLGIWHAFKNINISLHLTKYCTLAWQLSCCFLLFFVALDVLGRRYGRRIVRRSKWWWKFQIPLSAIASYEQSQCIIVYEVPVNSELTRAWRVTRSSISAVPDQYHLNWLIHWLQLRTYPCPRPVNTAREHG